MGVLRGVAGAGEVAVLRKRKPPKRKSIAMTLMRDVQGSAAEKLAMFEKMRAASGFANELPADLAEAERMLREIAGMEKGAKVLTFRHALRIPEYWLLVVTALAGAFGLPWWIAVPLATAGLSISSLPKYVELWPRVRAAGAEWEGWKTVALSLLNNIGAASAGFALGALCRWLWWSA